MDEEDNYPLTEQARHTIPHACGIELRPYQRGVATAIKYSVLHSARNVQ